MKSARRTLPVTPHPGDRLPAHEREAVSAAVQHCAGMPGNTLEVLHRVQDALGYIPERVVPLIAFELNRTRAEIHGVLSFYHDFLRAPPGRHVVRVCCAEACQAVGARRLAAHAQKRLGVDWHESSEDGRARLEPVYCLGNCALGPAVMIDRQLHGRVTPERFDALLADSETAP